MSGRPLTTRGTLCLCAALVLGIVANVFAAPVLVYVAVLLVALVLGAALVVHAPRRRGEVQRHIATDLLTVGATSRVTVQARVRPAPHARWRDQLPRAVSGVAEGEFTAGAQVQYELTGVRRGISVLGPFSLSTVDPFGLAQREQSFGDTRTITVVPETVALTPLPVALGAAGGSAQSRSSRLGQGSDDLTPRVYSAGDSMRRIHWRATAHRGDLMVRQEEDESSPEALIVLDRAASRWARPDEEDQDPLFETAVSLCASAALRLERDGYSVVVIDSAGVVLGTLRGQEDERIGLLVTLASVRPQGNPKELGALIGGAPPGPLTVITGAVDEEHAVRMRTAGAALPLLFTTSPSAQRMTADVGWHSAVITNESEVSDLWDGVLPAARMHRA